MTPLIFRSVVSRPHPTQGQKDLLALINKGFSLIPEEEMAKIEQRTRSAGGEVVKLLGSGSAFVSPAVSALEMIEAIAFDKRKIVPVAAYLQGEYGVKKLFLGVPVILGKNGIEEIIKVKLTAEEKKNLKVSINAVKKTCAAVDKTK